MMNYELFPFLMIFIYILIFVIILLFLLGIRIIKENQRGIQIRNKKYLKTVEPGFYYIIPFIDKFVKVRNEDYDRIFRELIDTGKMIHEPK